MTASEGSARTPLDQLAHDFQSHGWLVHMIIVDASMQRGVSSNWYPSRRWLDRVHDAVNLEDVPLDLDCGPMCSGFSYLPPRGPLLKYSNGPGWNFGAGLAFSATHELWKFVQCAAAADSNSINRLACEQLTRSQCRASDGLTDELCRQLHAGCGVHDELRWSRGHDGCAEPYFCVSA